jgi:hypothetical protein
MGQEHVRHAHRSSHSLDPMHADYLADFLGRGRVKNGGAATAESNSSLKTRFSGFLAGLTK